MESRKYTVILIDDESWTRDVLKCIGKWEELGLEVIAEASDGEYGLELVRKLKPDLIVTDVKMPNMDGLELGSILRAEHCNAKILYVSGYDDYRLVRSAFQLEAKDYLLKPVKPDELNKQLERCVQELEHEKKDNGQSGLQFEKIAKAPWLQAYEKLREQLYETLRARNDGMTSRRIQEIMMLGNQYQLDSCSRETMIYVYFDLYELLRRYLQENGFSFLEIFSPSDSSFVFGNETTFREIISYMGSLYEKAPERMEKLRKERGRINVKEIREYVDENFAQNITLDETAERFFVSREYLSKLFKKETGMGFQNYVTELKMKKAKWLLLEEKMAIKDIAQLLGYKENAHFYKVFKKYYGQTPGEMAGEQRKN